MWLGLDEKTTDMLIKLYESWEKFKEEERLRNFNHAPIVTFEFKFLEKWRIK